MFCRHSQDQPLSTESHQLTVTDSRFTLKCCFFPPSFSHRTKITPRLFSPHLCWLVYFVPTFCRSWCCNYTFCQSERVNIKRPNYANRPVIRGIRLIGDLLSLTCICLCAVSAAPGLHINRTACPRDCMRFNHQHWSEAMFRGRGGRRGGGVAQQHQITNNSPICIFLSMVQHLYLVHLPVHPKGVAELKELWFKAFAEECISDMWTQDRVQW